MKNIVLGEDITIDASVNIDKNLDGGGNKLNVPKDPSFTTGPDVPAVLTIDSNVEVKNIEIVTKHRTEYEIEVKGDGATLNNVTITREYASGHAGILVNADDVTVKDCTLNGATIGVFLDADETVTITGNTITTDNADKIWVTGPNYGNLDESVTLNISDNGAEYELVKHINNHHHYYASYADAHSAATIGDKINGVVVE